MTKLKVRTPADLISAVPYLIGFHPENSLVVAAVKGSHLAFVARIDLPEPGVPELEARAPILHLATLVAEQQPEGITLIGYGRPARVTPSLLDLSSALTKAGLRIVDEFRVADGRYWSFLCTKASCCPEEGTPCDPPDSVLAAEATYAGAVALPSRSDLEAQLAPVTGDQREGMNEAQTRALDRLVKLIPSEDDVARPSAEPEPIGPLLSGRRMSRCKPEVLRAGRVAVREAERRYRSGGRLTNDEVAWLGLLLVATDVRDYAWVRMGTDDWQVAFWSDVVRRVEPEYVAPPASLLAFIAWRTGRSALASIAVDRALEADRDYALAHMINAALFSAIPPSAVDGWPTPIGGWESLSGETSPGEGGVQSRCTSNGTADDSAEVKELGAPGAAGVEGAGTPGAAAVQKDSAPGSGEEEAGARSTIELKRPGRRGVAKGKAGGRPGVRDAGRSKRPPFPHHRA
ncbi:DUF4192 domain-containing protein [Actinoplanes sp. NPDC049548]|uniref:DUF4192 domain-containing protein n=1 Tax=Actinoplanes sp. NPDC049548 TaxID=3155152 RepID=UPI0034497CD3